MADHITRDEVRPLRIRDDHQRRAVLELIDALAGFAQRQAPNHETMTAACSLVLEYLHRNINTQSGPLIGPLAQLLRDHDSKGAYAYLVEVRTRLGQDALLARWRTNVREFELVPAGGDLPMEVMREAMGVFQEARRLPAGDPARAQIEDWTRENLLS